jgi:hypothetical protein
MKRKTCLILGLFFLVAVAILDKIAYVYHLYWKYQWFDDIPHFLGGISLGFLIIFVIWESGKTLADREIFFKVIIVIFLIGFLWELFEFGVDRYAIRQIGLKTLSNLEINLSDSLSDLLFDGLGGLASGLLFIFLNNKNKLKSNIDENSAN